MRTRIALFSAACLLVGCASGAPRPAAPLVRSDDALAYYPLLSGWGWAYDLERDGAHVLALYAVVERSADRATVQHVDERLEYDLRRDGIARRDGGDNLLKSPVRGGATWPVSGGTATVVETGSEVKLPSGTYRDCAVVEEVRREPARATRTTYCRDVGPVAVEVRVANPGTGVLDLTALARLLSVTRPESTP
jgi:hypothetical protein